MSSAMEACAAMVDVIDQKVGQVVKKLKAKLDNKFVLVMLNNGAESDSHEAFPLPRIPIPPGRQSILSQRHGQYRRAGLRCSGMATVGCKQPLRRVGCTRWMCRRMGTATFSSLATYRSTHCRTLLVGRIRFIRSRTYFPATMNLAGANAPKSRFKAQEMVPVRGKSWLQWLSGKKSRIHDSGISLGWALHACAAIRRGDTLPSATSKPGRIELFNMKDDP